MNKYNLSGSHVNAALSCVRYFGNDVSKVSHAHSMLKKRCHFILKHNKEIVVPNIKLC